MSGSHRPFDETEVGHKAQAVVGDFVGDRECVTHHACDCIVAKTRRLDAAHALVLAQAEDDGLWFLAEAAPEAYLQQGLRRLHAVIEGTQLQAAPDSSKVLGLGEDNKP